MSTYDVALPAEPTAVLPEVKGENRSWRFARRAGRFFVRVVLLWLAQAGLTALDVIGKGAAVAQMATHVASPTTLLLLSPHYLVIIPQAHHLGFLEFFVVVYSRQIITKPIGYLAARRTVEESECAVRQKPVEQRRWWFTRAPARLVIRFEAWLERRSRRGVLIAYFLCNVVPPLNPLGWFPVVGSPSTWAGCKKLRTAHVMVAAATAAAIYTTLLYYAGPEIETAASLFVGLLKGGVIAAIPCSYYWGMYQALRAQAWRALHVKLIWMPASFIVTVAVVSFIILVAILLFLMQGAPFVPTGDKDVRAMLKAAKIQKTQKIVDLGAGDGKLVMAYAKLGYHIDGVEIKPWLVRRAQKQIEQNKLDSKASMIRANFWQFDTSGYDVVLLYAIPHIMGRLEKKLQAELKPGSIIISNYFTFPNLKPVRAVGNIRVYKI